MSLISQQYLTDYIKKDVAPGPGTRTRIDILVITAVVKVSKSAYLVQWKIKKIVEKRKVPGQNVTRIRLNAHRKSILMPKQTHPGRSSFSVKC
jgi:hypothetical protein